MFGEVLPAEKPEQRPTRARPAVLNFRGESFNLTTEAVAVVEGIIARRKDLRELDKIFASAVRCLKRWRKKYGAGLWFCGVEFSGAELALEARGEIGEQRTPEVGRLLAGESVEAAAEGERRRAA